MLNKFFLPLLALLILFFTSPASAGANSLRNHNHGDKLPPFTLATLGGEGEFQFTPGNGKPAALLFFSVDPDFRKKRSLALLSELDSLTAKYKNKADIMGIFSEDKKADIVSSFTQNRNLKIPILLDPAQEVYNQYGVFMMPMVVFLDAEGRLHEVVPYTYNVREHVEGNLKLMLGEWTVDQFQQSLEPKETEVKSEEEKEYIRRINYGKVMISRKMYSQAVREFSTAVKLSPKSVEGYKELGYTQLALKEYGEAETTFREALQIDSESDEAIAGLGLALYGKGDLDAALPELENALIVPDPKLEVVVALADIHELKGNMQKAMRLNKLAVSKLMTMYEHRWQ